MSRKVSCVMSTNTFLFPLAAAGATAFALVAAIFVPYDYSWAAERSLGAIACPKPSAFDIKTKLPEVKVILDQTDEYAALESVQFALTEVADGSSYVWHRAHGRLSGVVKPLSSFKDTHGSVCRHAVVVLSGVEATKRTEIVACRLPTGIWQLES
jgi:surface antigen